MGFEKYKYFLAWKDSKILLFESRFKFLTEDACLAHYEKGITRGLFQLDHTRINLIWTDLALWGLIGRICPVELVRILCAFGCALVVDCKDSQDRTLTKSFAPITYVIPMASSEQSNYRHLYHVPLETGSEDQIPLFLELANKLVLGSYYTTHNHDVDSQFPKFCKLFEKDCCIGNGVFRHSLFELFHEGFPIDALGTVENVTLVEKDCANDVLHGYGAEESLFYVAS